MYQIIQLGSKDYKDEIVLLFLLFTYFFFQMPRMAMMILTLCSFEEQRIRMQDGRKIKIAQIFLLKNTAN